MTSFTFKGQGPGPAVDDAPWQAVAPSVLRELDHPSAYHTEDAGLIAAVNTAITLRMPLLLTGAPGVGKTQLAARVAYEMGLSEPIEVSVKSYTESTDFFYRIDHMERLHSATLARATSGPSASPAIARPDGSIVASDGINVRRFLSFEGLGLAILRTYSEAELYRLELLDSVWPPNANSDASIGERVPSPRPSVVLIDEIDKAPDDVPNDLLEDIRRNTFKVPGLGSFEIQAQQDNVNVEPIVIITSNSEKALPAAFLRRCIYYHMPAPSEATLREIIARRLHERFRLPSALEEASLRFYLWLSDERVERVRKRPSTAELLAWLLAMHHRKLDDTDVRGNKSDAWRTLAQTVLLKHEEDQAGVDRLIDQCFGG